MELTTTVLALICLGGFIWNQDRKIKIVWFILAGLSAWAAYLQFTVDQTFWGVIFGAIAVGSTISIFIKK